MPTGSGYDTGGRLMSTTGAGLRPEPRVAYELWLDRLTRAGWRAQPEAEQVPVADALGRVMAARVMSKWPSPRSACAAMDGIAVRAADLAVTRTRGSSGTTPAGSPGTTSDGTPAVISAGAWGDDGTLTLAAGAFEWIDTGDPIPDGMDTVVMRERLLPQADGSVIVTGQAGHPVSTGQHVRAAGEDFAAGEELVPAGRRLRPADLAVAAAGGHVAVSVARRPVVAIIPTGDEIRPVGELLHPGDITDTNSLMLAARCGQLGAVPTVSPVAPDDPDVLAAELRRVAAAADLVLVIAGSSRGRGDHTPAVLAQVGGVAVAGVAVRPGHPALLGHVKRLAAGPGRAKVAPVVGLPGYPLATAVIFELFVAPLVHAIAGHTPSRHRLRARLDRDWLSPADVEDWVLVTLTPAGDGSLLAAPARRGAGSISRLARADAWWTVPVGLEHVTAGTQIEVFPVPGTD
jgi:putative molybdopterin biosynthesis protein